MFRRPADYESFLQNSRDTSVDARVNIMRFAGLAYAGSRLNSWCYSTEEKKLYFGFSEYPDELSAIFMNGKHLDYLSEHRDRNVPFLLSDSMDMLWIAEFDRTGLEETGSLPTLVYVLGPVFTSGTSPAVVTEKLRQLEFSLAQRRKIENILHDIPVMAEGTFNQYARMLHFALYGELADDSFHLDRTRLNEEEPDENKITYEDLRGDRTSLSRILMTEAGLLSIIRSGKYDAARIKMLREAIVPADYTNGDSLMNAKYDLTSFCSRAVQAAIEGGLPIRIAKTVELQFIKMVAACRKLTEIRDLSTLLIKELTDRVKQVNENPALSESTLLIQDYIQANLTTPLTLEVLARQFGYTEYYLSRKFNEETGMRISDYLNRERIEYAKNLLTNTKKPVQEICDLLQYSNHSYFGQVFKKMTGQSPQEYRRNHARSSSSGKDPDYTIMR